MSTASINHLHVVPRQVWQGAHPFAGNRSGCCSHPRSLAGTAQHPLPLFPSLNQMMVPGGQAGIGWLYRYWAQKKQQRAQAES